MKVTKYDGKSVSELKDGSWGKTDSETATHVKAAVHEGTPYPEKFIATVYSGEELDQLYEDEIGRSIISGILNNPNLGHYVHDELDSEKNIVGSTHVLYAAQAPKDRKLRNRLLTLSAVGALGFAGIAAVGSAGAFEHGEPSHAEQIHYQGNQTVENNFDISAYLQNATVEDLDFSNVTIGGGQLNGDFTIPGQDAQLQNVLYQGSGALSAQAVQPVHATGILQYNPVNGTVELANATFDGNTEQTTDYGAQGNVTSSGPTTGNLTFDQALAEVRLNGSSVPVDLILTNPQINGSYSENGSFDGYVQIGNQTVAVRNMQISDMRASGKVNGVLKGDIRGSGSGTSKFVYEGTTEAIVPGSTRDDGPAYLTGAGLFTLGTAIGAGAAGHRANKEYTEGRRNYLSVGKALINQSKRLPDILSGKEKAKRKAEEEARVKELEKELEDLTTRSKELEGNYNQLKGEHDEVLNKYMESQKRDEEFDLDEILKKMKKGEAESDEIKSTVRNAEDVTYDKRGKRFALTYGEGKPRLYVSLGSKKRTRKSRKKKTDPKQIENNSKPKTEPKVTDEIEPADDIQVEETTTQETKKTYTLRNKPRQEDDPLKELEELVRDSEKEKTPPPNEMRTKAPDDEWNELMRMSEDPDVDHETYAKRFREYTEKWMNKSN